MRRLSALFVAALLVGVVPAPGSAGGHRISVVIRWTEFGTPHIVAGDYLSLGYGYGFAFAQDNLCTIAEDYVTVDGERSRFFGPAGSYLQGGNGVVTNNLHSDLFFRSIIDAGTIGKLVSAPPPDGPKPEIVEALRGYVEGYNRYLRSVGGAAGVRDPRCRGEEWVRPITIQQEWRRFYQLVLLAGQDVVIDGIAEAAPPAPGAPVPAFDAAATARLIAKGWESVRLGLGSN